MSLWIAYNDQRRTQERASVIVEAQDELDATIIANGALLDYSVALFPGCWGQRRRFAIIDWVDKYDGPEPPETPYVILGP
jgi:hypothetical protein